MISKIRNIYFLFRVVLMKLLYKVLEKVGRMTFPDDDLNINKGKWMNDYLCFYRVLTFNIDYFDYHWKKVPWETFKKRESEITNACGEPYKMYTWNKLKDSIAKEGLKTRLIAQFDIEYSGDARFTLVDGNHRLRCLEELYGSDYKVEVDAYVPFTYLDIIKTLTNQKRAFYTSRKNTINNKTY